MTAAPKPLSVTFVSPFAQRAGSERYLELVLAGIPPEWVRDVVILEEGPFADDLKARKLEVTVLPTSPRLPGIVQSARGLRRILRRNRPSLVHANGIKAALVAVIATFGTNIPVVWVKHDLSFDRSLARIVAARCRLVVGVSEAAVRVFRGRLRRKVRVVYNALPPIDVDRVAARRQVLEQLGAEDEEEVVALVGRLYAMKGQHELIEIVPDLRQRRPRVRVAIAGAEDASVPDYAVRLRRRAAELELGESLTFVGPVDDAPRFIAGCDVLVAPSVPAERGNTESFSLVALEAMAVGTPVAGYAEGGLPETLGPCALLVPPGDRAGLVDAIVRVLEDGALRQHLAVCGEERAANQFSLERMLASLAACYRETASAPERGT